jgi:hypothetical protein
VSEKFPTIKMKGKTKENNKNKKIRNDMKNNIQERGKQKKRNQEKGKIGFSNRKEYSNR